MNYVLYLLKIILGFFDKHDKNIKRSINLYTEDYELNKLLESYNQQIVMLLTLVIKKILSNSVEFRKATLDIEADSKIDDVCLDFKLSPEFSLNATHKINGEEEKIDISYIRGSFPFSRNQSIVIDPILLELVSGLKSNDKDKLLLIIIAIYSCQLTVSHFLYYQQKKSKESYDSDKKQILKFSYCVIFKFVVLLYGDTNLINHAFSNVRFEDEKENESFNIHFSKISKNVKKWINLDFRRDFDCHKKEHDYLKRVLEFITNDENIIEFFYNKDRVSSFQIKDKKILENNLLLSFVNCYDALFQMSKKIKFDKNFNVRGGEETSHILIALLFRTDFRYNKHDKKITNEFSSGIFGFCYLLYKRVADFSFVLDDNTGDIKILEDILKR